MIISVRLNEEDKKILDEITFKLDNEWKMVFGKGSQTTSDTIRYCIRNTHEEIIESNKMDNT